MHRLGIREQAMRAMSWGISVKNLFRKEVWGLGERTATAPPPRILSITCRGNAISRDDLFRYTHGHFLVNETAACNRRYVRFDIDKLCAVAAVTGTEYSPVRSIEKMEGGFSRALLLRKEDGSEIVAKIPFPIAGPKKYTTASEVAVLQYLHTHTAIPVPKVLAWNLDASNPVGVEYIIMEKAPGVPLVQKMDEMSDQQQLNLVKQLTKLEGQLTAIQLPAYGSLYLKESMTPEDKHIELSPALDPNLKFCIGPSCDRSWFHPDSEGGRRNSPDNGPWPNLSTFGIALANREIARVEAGGTDMKAGPPRGTVSEQLAVLKMAKDVFSLLDSGTLLDRVSQPALWHTDLHLGNIFVNSDDPTQITCIIDWQSINVAPIFLQARFPDFLPIDEDYDFSTTALPKPPPNYEQMDADEKEFTMLRLKEARLAKAYEISSAIQNKRGYRALAIPSFLRGLFTHCENITEEGILPLRNCLIDLSKQWDDVEFTANCPIVFSEAEIEMHNRQYQEYLDFQKVQKLARILLSTDEEGWIDPRLDISQKLVQNEQVLKEVMRRSDQYHMSPEKVKSIWPFLGRSEVSTPTLSLN